MFSIISSNGEFIGGCGLYHIDTTDRTAEFGRIVIDGRLRGREIGSASVKCAIEIARNDIGLRKLYLEVKENNIPAIKAYRKTGFEIDSRNNGCVYMSLELKDA